MTGFASRTSYLFLAGLLAIVLAACSQPGDLDPVSTAELTVATAGEGSGSVTSDPAGIECGTDCTAEFDIGTTVTLTATAAEGSTFTGWGGSCSGTTPTCTVDMDSDASVTANFALVDTTAEYTVTMAEPQNGSVASSDGNLNCGAGNTACEFTYQGGTEVTLTATPAEGFVFDGWTGAGCDAVTEATCTFTVSADTTVSAAFIEEGIEPASGNVSERTRTASSVEWTPGAWTAGDRTEAQRTPSLASVVQEIVDREGWTSGNSMAFILEGPATRNVEAVAYESGIAPAGVAELVIEVDGVEAARVAIADPLDDIEEFTTTSTLRDFPAGTMYNGDDLEMTYDAGNDYNQLIGLRFVNVGIESGANVTNAYIQFTASATEAGGQALTIFGEGADNAETFSCDLGCP